MKKILVVGTGGLAREFTEFFKPQLEIVGYIGVNDKEYLKYCMEGNLYLDSITPNEAKVDNCVIAVGNPKLKRELMMKLSCSGFKFPPIVHDSVLIKPDNLAEGVVISPNCIVGTNVNFGQFVYLNFMVGVGHDTIIGDYVQINPGAQIGGASTIGNSVLIGSNSTIRQGISVGNNSTVGSGAVVLSKVRENITVFGNPARKLKF